MSGFILQGVHCISFVQVASGGGSSSSSTLVSKSDYSAGEVDASEYEPQIVELPSPEAEQLSRQEEEEEEEEDGATDGSRSGSEDSSSDSRSSRSSSEEPATEKERPASNGKVGSSEDMGSMELTEKEREELWVKKLGEMRERYLATMDEKERENFFKLLEV